MKTLSNGGFKDFKEPTGVVLGNFDGIHIGHTMLVNYLVNCCKARNLLSCLYTFKDHPQNIIREKEGHLLLTSNKERRDILNSLNLDFLILEEFTKDFSQMKPEEFVKKVLVERLNAKLVVVGENYRFGYKGEGDVEKLRSFAHIYGLDVRVLPLLYLGTEVVSSSRIRKKLLNGCVEDVCVLLGRFFSLTGEVIHGKKLGRMLGFPTANVILENFQALPKTGVYATKTILEEKTYSSITNISFKEKKDIDKTEDFEFVIETHIFDFDAQIYGEQIKILFLYRVRDEKTFSSLEDLSRQMRQDVEYVKGRCR